MQSVNVIGEYFGQTGYAIHTKQIANALNKHYKVSVTTGKPQSWERTVNDEELKMLQRNPEDADINIMIGFPHYWKYYFKEGKKFIGVCVWEGDKVPAFWIEDMEDDRVDQIWVPSNHVRNAILNTLEEHFSLKPIKSELFSKTYTELLDNKLKIVPHGVDKNIFYRTDKPKDDKMFTFTANKGWRGNMLDRGGLQYLFKAFNAEFSEDEPVQLLVKINSVYQEIDMAQAVENLGLRKKGGKIGSTIENFHYEALKDIYNMGDVFITTSMGEAFNLPCLESMACGVPVITTEFGGQTDYVNSKNGWILKEGEMFEVKHDVMYEGVSWKRPDIKEIRKMLRHCYENRDEVKKKSEQVLEDSDKWTWECAAIKGKQFIDEISNDTK